MLYSVALLLVIGLVGAKVFANLRMPRMLGLILVGVTAGPYVLNLLAPDLIEISGDVRMLALIIILLRAGLGISREALNKVGPTALKMSAIPCLLEGTTITIVAQHLLGLSLLEAGMLGFILAAVSPAVVVPEMLALKKAGLGEDKGIPIIILGGASIDDVFAITIFTAFLGMGTKQASTPLYLQALQIPFQVLGGIALGILVGYILSRVFRSSRIPTTDSDEMILAVGGAIAVTLLGRNLQVAGLLSVMTAGFVILETAPAIAERLSHKLEKVWRVAEIFLFTLIGAQVDIRVALHAGAAGVLVVLIGLVARSIGVFIATAGSGLNLKERAFSAIAYIPKATVQAAVGGVPLAAGVESGNLILAVAVVAIIITAPLGAIGIRLTAPRWLSSPELPSEEVSSNAGNQ